MAQPKKEDKDGGTALAARARVDTLLSAAKEGDVKKFKEAAELCDEGHGPEKLVRDTKDGNGRTALHFAASQGHTELCRYLLDDLKVPVNARDDHGQTPLALAAMGNHVDASKLLLEKGADPSVCHEKTAAAPIHHAASAGAGELIGLLASKKADVNAPSSSGTPLIWAAGYGGVTSAEELLKHGADPNRADQDGVTPLLAAAGSGSLKIAEALVKAKADPNKDAGGATPLHVASDKGDLQMVQLLLNAGADTNLRDAEGARPINAAAAGGHNAVVEALFPKTTPEKGAEWSLEALLKKGSLPGSSGRDDKTTPQNAAGDPKAADEEVKVGPPPPPDLSNPKVQRAQEAKSRGDEAFKRKQFMVAVDAYTQSLDLDPSNATVLSNRSICWLRAGQPEHALTDAKSARKLAPYWPKACYREGAAHRAMLKFEDAATAFYEGVQLDPENKELVEGFQEAIKAGREAHGVKQQNGGSPNVSLAEMKL